jgi:hypothetical protein
MAVTNTDMDLSVNESVYNATMIGMAKAIEELFVSRVGQRPGCSSIHVSMNPLPPGVIRTSCSFGFHLEGCPAKDWDKKASEFTVGVCRRVVGLVKNQ